MIVIGEPFDYNKHCKWVHSEPMVRHLKNLNHQIRKSGSFLVPSVWAQKVIYRDPTIS